MFYLIYGNSINLVQDEIKKLICDKKYESLSLDSVTLDEILTDIEYSSMFEEEKILIIKNFDKAFESKKDNSNSLEKLNSFLKNKKQKITIIFISESKINERSKLNKEILQNLDIIKTPIITKNYELVNLMKEIIRKEGYGISQNALEIFCEKCNLNYDIALKEFEKIKALKKNNLITEDDVENLVSNYNMSDMFAFKDAVINKNIKKALSLLEELEYSKMELLPLVVMLAKEYQVLYNVKKLFLNKCTSEEVSSKLGNMHPYRVKILREAANKYNEEEIKDKILDLCNLDLKIVSQDNIGFLELKKFIIEL